jgi:hypothetical protein
MRSRASVFALALLLPGCALIKSGTSQMVTFKSDPPGAEIWLNGKKRPELTPATIEVPKDDITFQFKKAGFATHSESLQFRTCSWFYWSLLFGVITGGIDWLSGAWCEFDVPEEGVVRKLRLAGDTEDDIYISSNPVGASIKVGGIDVRGITGSKGRGVKVGVKWGDAKRDRERQIILTLEGFETAFLNLHRGEKDLHWDFKQKPDEIATLFESQPAGAEVLINGVKEIERAPATFNLKWYTYEKEYEVEFRLEGYKPWRKTIKSKKEGPKVVAVLEEIERPALVRVECLPSGAVIEVDGQPAGVSPGDVQVTWSISRKSHALKFSRPGYESKVVTVDESQKTLSVRLAPALPRLP